jgi:hypothetical protein
MPTSFQPKFVDLVRNYTTTTGTADFKLGSVANGYVSFTAACQVGDQFYYSAIGIDKPAEREVGRGTLLSGGVIQRDPISGTKTNFSTGTKSIALIAAAEWFSSVQAGNGALVAANNLADLPSATSARTNLGLGSAAVEAVDRFAVAIADRGALAAHSASSIAYLREAGREGTFVWSSANNAANVANDPLQAVYIARSSDPTGATGAWVRKDKIVRPSMFGAAADGVTDDAAALNAFFAFAGLYRGFKYCVDGDYAIGSGLILDGGTSGVEPNCEIDFGRCRITALNAIPRMLTVQDFTYATFRGQIHLRGTNYGNDVNCLLWTCDVGLYLNNVSGTVFPEIYCEGFSYAGIDMERQPSSNNDLVFGRIKGVRIGSGAPLAGRSRSGTYSGAVNSGADGSVIQYTQMTVTNLPPAYAQANSGSPNFSPTFQLLLQINGQLHQVKSITEVAVLDSNGLATVLPNDGYAIDVDSSGDGWVRVAQPDGALRVRVTGTAGMADDENGVPEPIRQGVLRLVAHLFTARDGEGGEPPAAVTALWRPYRRMRLS